MEVKSKRVEYEGKEYDISFESYGYGDSRFLVNGEPTKWYVSNERLLHLNTFKETAKRAIQEYISKKAAEENFNKWDGKL